MAFGLVTAIPVSAVEMVDSAVVALSDYARTGQPPTYTDEQIIRILEIACRTPEEYGYEASHWSLNQLVDVVIKEGIAESISAKTISRFLKYGENPPASRLLLAAFFRPPQGPALDSRWK